MKLILIVALTLGLVSARCPNDCSGHGTCSAGSVCQCWKNHAGNDCSQRLCYQGLSFIDTPLGDINANNALDIVLQANYQKTNGLVNELYPADYGLARLDNKAEWNEGHFYAECSGRGKCDTTTGQCACFPGYEGEGCVRTTCPNNCGSHGQCVLIDISADVESESYDSWDAQKTQKCKCDPGYTGPNCNQKQCVMGVDPIENLYTNTDSVWKIEWKKQSATTDLNGDVHFTITYDDDFGDSWTTAAITLLYSATKPVHQTETRTTSDLISESFNKNYIAEQVNASLQALPNDVIRESYVWAVQHDGSKLTHAYPYPDNSITKFNNSDLESSLATSTTDKSKSTATGKSPYTNDAKYRMPFWGNNDATIAKAFNCASNSLCLFVRLNEPKGSKNMVVHYKAQNNASSVKAADVYGNSNSVAGKTVVEVSEVGSTRAWSTVMDGSPTINYNSNKDLHVCSKRGICDYTTGTCKCFSGYSGYNCGKRNSLGTN
jgi:hypothetical protein